MAAGMEKNDVRYATGLVAADPFFLLADGPRLHLLVSALEAARARKTCPAARLHTPAELFPGGVRPPPPGAQVLALVRKLRFRAVRVGPYFPHGIARALERGGVRVELVPGPAFPRRAVKTRREVACIAQAQRAAAAALRAAVACIRGAAVARSGELRHAGRVLTAERVKELIARTLQAHGCSAEDPIVAVGPQGARPHDTGSGPLRAGVPVVLDIFPRNQATGYWGDITRTVVRGRASAEVRRMHRAVLAAQKRALAMVRPGVAGRTIHRAVEEYFRRAGFATRLAPAGRECGFIHGTGHGVGLDIHEAPALRNGPGRLAAGQVVTVEPGLYYPGRGGVRIEDTVLVTRTGHKILASFPKNLE